MSRNTVKLNVLGMHCAGCEIAIENSIKQLPGIDFVKADYENDQVGIVYDGQHTTPEAIYDSIKNAGYEPQGITPTQKTGQSVASKTASQNPKKFVHGLKKITAITLAVLGMVLILCVEV